MSSPGFTLRAPLTRADLPGLCARVTWLLTSSDPGPVTCDVGALPGADAVTVDALARLTLLARRQGRTLRVCGASADLRELVALMGLGDVLTLER